MQPRRHAESLQKVAKGKIDGTLDNAGADSVMKLSANEVVAQRSLFRRRSRKNLAAEPITFSSVQRHNTERGHGYLESTPPRGYETNYYAACNVSSTGRANTTAT